MDQSINEILKLKTEVEALKIAIDNLLDQRDEILTHMGDCQDSCRRNNIQVPLWRYKK